jgi:tetratricopeptide (TPR) repeat protein
MRREMIGLFVVGVISMTVGVAAAQHHAGQVRTGLQTPIRTGFQTPLRTTAGNYGRLTPQTGSGFHRGGGYFPSYYYGSGTSLGFNGDGFSVSLNGGLAGQLGYSTIAGNAYGSYYSNSYGNSYGTSTTCVAVQDANVVLSNLPTNVRDQTTVLRGADYGWDYDVICLPESGGYNNNYPRYGYGYGWYPPGNTYYRSGQSVANATNGWGRLSQPNAGSTATQTPAKPAVPPTAIEVARVSLALGNLDSAEEQYRKHLKENPDDSQALREFALVMFDAERPEEGFAALRKAYRDDPELASKPMNLRAYGFDGPRIRRLMGKVSPASNRIKSSSGWLALAVVLQGQGKDRAARRMLDKAEALGLDAEIVTALRAKLDS